MTTHGRGISLVVLLAFCGACSDKKRSSTADIPADVPADVPADSPIDAGSDEPEQPAQT